MSRRLAWSLSVVLALAGVGLWLASPSSPSEEPTPSAEPAPVDRAAAPRRPGSAPVPSTSAVAPDAGLSALLEVHVQRAGRPVAAQVTVLRDEVPLTADSLPVWVNEARAMAGKDGVVTLPVTPGTLLVVARAEGAGRATASTRVQPGQRAVLELELPDGHTVTGVVLVGATGEKVVGASVRLSLGAGAVRRRTVETAEALSWFATTAADGSFRFEGVPPGLVEVEAVAPGYGRARLAHVAVPGPGVRVALAASAFVDGFVFLPDGGPAAGAWVSAAGGDEVTTTTASERGAFGLEVEPGAFFLSAHLGPWAARSRTRLTVGPNRTLSGVTLRLEGGATIAGRVAGPDDAGIPQARVVVTSAMPVGWPDSVLVSSAFKAAQTLGEVRTDADGRFLIEGVPAGAWDVTASCEDGVQFARELMVLDGQRFEVSFVFAGRKAITGFVLAPDGGPLEGAVVAVGADFDVFPSHLLRTRTGADGRFTLAELPLGRVWVGAWLDGSPAIARELVEVRAGPAEPVTLVLAPRLGQLRGRVTGHEGVVLVGASADLGPSGGVNDIARAFTDGEGRFSMTLPEGEWSVMALAPTSAAVRAVVKEGAPAEVTLEVARSRFLVQEPDGTAARHAWVWLRSEKFGVGLQADEEGVARIAREDAAGYSRVEAHCESRRGTAVLPRGEWETVVVRCQPAARVEGVLRRAGPPVSGFTVRWPEGGLDRRVRFTGDRFVLDEFPTGETWLEVRTVDGWKWATGLNLSPGTSAHLEAKLEPAGPDEE
ncbi:MAG: carboxypeptidase regulatory-like domain-containing protein [Myxococcota bacterium]